MRQLEHHETERLVRTFPLIVACDDWHGPQNVGGLFRLADAFGVERLLLGGRTPTPPNRKIGSTARSTQQWIPFSAEADIAPALRALQAEGYTLLGLEITDRSRSIADFDFRPLEKIVLVAGSENEGIQTPVLELLQAAVHIPMYGRNSSMNVTASLAIALFEISRQWAGR